MITKTAVIGAGTMGHAIALCFAAAGYDVAVFESFEPMRNSCKERIKSQLDFFCGEELITPDESKAALNRITVFDDLKESVKDADYIIEAIPEQMELKQQLLAELDSYCKPDAIFASNTSSLPLGEMTKNLSAESRSRTMVCHWYNPAHIMPIVELSYFGNMPLELYRQVEDFYKKIGKQPVKVLKDIPGLVANRIQQAVAREVFSLMQMGAAEPEDIDRALKFGPAFRYATTGQLEVADFGGLDIWYAVGNNLLPDMDNASYANPILKEKVTAGKLGFKSGEGFFLYPEDKKQELLNQFNKRLVNQLKASKNYS